MKAMIEPFEEYTSEYEAWFENNRFVYQSELRAVKRQLPHKGDGIEVGVGSGRFAAPLGIKLGLDPSGKMRELSRSRGVTAIGGVAERLPFGNGRFRFVLMVTTICFLDDMDTALREAFRVLKTGGVLIIGFIDRNSPVGMSYESLKSESEFYKRATFYSADEVASHLKMTGFVDLTFSQTIFHRPAEIKNLEPVKGGFGEGSFVVVKASKPEFSD